MLAVSPIQPHLIMDLQCPSFQVLFTFLLLTVILLLKIGKRGHNNNSSASKLPPGPWKLPIIGNIHQLIGTLPHGGLRDLAKKHGPVMHLRLGEVSTIVVSSAELAKEVMKTHDIFFASRPQVLAARIVFYDSKDIGFAPYGGYWRKLRKICTQELLSAKRVQSYRPIREKEVLNLIKWIGSRAGLLINLTQKVISATYSITSQAAFGNQCKDQEEFIYAAKDINKAVSGFNVVDVFPSFKLLHRISGVHPKLQRLQKQADRIMENIIKEHIQATTTAKSDEAQDLVDVLLKFHETCGGSELSLTTDNIKAVILELTIRKLVTVSWQQVCIPRNEAGLGLRNLKALNTAGLISLGWQTLLQSSSWGSFARKCFTIFRHMKFQYFTSSVWHGLKRVLPLLFDHSRWIIGDGNSVLFWSDKWLNSSIVQQLNMGFLSHVLKSRVADFILDQQWALPSRFSDLYPDCAKQILEIPLPIAPESDILIWENSSSGLFSFSDGYELVRPHFEKSDWASSVWCSFIPPRYSILA